MWTCSCPECPVSYKNCFSEVYALLMSQTLTLSVEPGEVQILRPTSTLFIKHRGRQYHWMKSPTIASFNLCSAMVFPFNCCFFLLIIVFSFSSSNFPSFVCVKHRGIQCHWMISPTVASFNYCSAMAAFFPLLPISPNFFPGSINIRAASFNRSGSISSFFPLLLPISISTDLPPSLCVTCRVVYRFVAFWT